MSDILHCRRGTVAFAAVIALVPLIGFVALGAEAGSWYVTKQHAQNAADAAAYSGALALACTNTQTGTNCTDTVVAPVQLVAYRGKQFAAKNGFCNTGDTSYPGSRCVASLPSGTSQSVAIDVGVYSAGTWTTNAGGQFVRAIIDQQQPVYLAAVLGFSTVVPGATAIAKVNQVKQLCGLGLGRYSGSGSPTSALIFAGSQSLNGNGCGFQSDNTVKFSSAPSFNGTGWAVYSAAGCQNGGTCDPGVPYNFSMPPALNPLTSLDSLYTASSVSGTGNPCTGFSGKNANVGTGQTCSIAANTPTTAYSGNLTVSGTGSAIFQTGGTFFFKDSALSFGATTPGGVTGTNVNIVLVGNSSLSITGTANLSANYSNTLYPALNGVLIDDQAPNRSSLAVTINGSAGVTLSLGGTMYFPNVDVTMSGNSQSTNTACTEVIANSINFSGGTSYLSTQSCASGTVPVSQVVSLVR